MFPTTGATVAATVETDPTAFRAPACVPGSHHVLLASHTPAGARVEDSETEQTEEQRPAYLVLTDTESGRRRHVAEIRGRSAFSISPDGRRIAFIDGSTTRFGAIRGQLHVARLEDGVPGEPRHIADAPSVLAFFWSPDGSRLLYFQPAFEGEEPTELLLRYTVTDFADGSTHQFPPVRLSPAFANEVVYRFDQFDRGADIWAPDGSAIVAGLVDQTGAPGVYVLPATPDGPVPARVGAGDVPVWRQGYRAGDTDRIALLNACSLPIDICMFR
jgi:dipeptidyl aminopeptidase/acylaminoacyl peptidase